MYRIIICATNLRLLNGNKIADKILEGFSHRPRHSNVQCYWEKLKKTLVLKLDNDFDRNGLATLEEFSDEISATCKPAELGNGDIKVVSVTSLDNVNN
jgi:hypothetical protein